MKKYTVLLLIFIALLLALYVFTTRDVTAPINEEPEVTNSYAQNDSLKVISPEIGEVITNPLTLTGEVRGTWLFEADAPVVLTDWDGKIIAEGYIQTKGDWMTEDFVPFTGTLTFETPVDIGDFSNRGNLIFHKANPSGLPEHADVLEYQVRFW